MASEFHGPTDAHVAITAPHCGPGGTMHFNFGGSTFVNGTLGSHTNLCATNSHQSKSASASPSRPSPSAETPTS